MPIKIQKVLWVYEVPPSVPGDWDDRSHASDTGKGVEGLIRGSLGYPGLAFCEHHA